jgi:predicted phage terminase large subunit-like protein
VTRLEPGAGQVLSMTRWHPDDLGGWLLAGAAGEWRVLDLCAIPETKEDAKRDPLKRKIGEPLWPERWTPAQMKEKRLTVGAYNWASMYQQRPRRSDGSLFKRAWFGVFHDRGDHYELTPPVGQGPTRRIPKDQCVTFQIVDPAASLKTSADLFVDGTFVQTPTNDLLVRDILRTRVEGPDQVGLMRTGLTKWSAAWVGVEKVAYQLTLFQAARRAGLPVRAITADKDKFSRALSASARYEAGTIFHPAEAPWLAEYEQELVDFPNGAHDDQVDVVSYAAAALLTSQPINLELPVLRRGS